MFLFHPDNVQCIINLWVKISVTQVELSSYKGHKSRLRNLYAKINKTVLCMLKKST